MKTFIKYINIFSTFAIILIGMTPVILAKHIIDISNISTELALSYAIYSIYGMIIVLIIAIIYIALITLKIIDLQENK